MALRGIHFFAFVRANRLREKRREKRRGDKKRREEEKKKKGIECLELLYGILDWNCLEHVWNSCLG